MDPARVRQTVSFAMGKLAEKGQRLPTIKVLDEFLTSKGLMDSTDIKSNSDLIFEVRDEELEKRGHNKRHPGPTPIGCNQPLSTSPPSPDESTTNEVNDAKAKDVDATEQAGMRRPSFDRRARSTPMSLFRPENGEFVLVQCKYHQEKESYIQAKTLRNQEMGGEKDATVEFQWKKANPDPEAAEDQTAPRTLFVVLGDEEAERWGVNFDVLVGTECTAEIAQQRATLLLNKKEEEEEEEEEEESTIEEPYLALNQGSSCQSRLPGYSASGSSTSSFSQPTTIYNQTGTIYNIFNPQSGVPASNSLGNLHEEISAISQLGRSVEGISVEPKSGTSASPVAQDKLTPSFSGSGGCSSPGTSHSPYINGGAPSQTRLESTMPNNHDGTATNASSSGKGWQTTSRLRIFWPRP